ncbi:hypothetical protein [Bdellovibrio reynosensis]|uniref:Uncharacterized protein n=1 Tax=Bdellovibrio reynosensis TaxID=2835041 RepID=A0ABY4CAP3_9BACT|nr:hypothetical protein [Bdellovibrio reynosensis]UOF02015.1 hypothetical protein MNR06_03485 [Bdellovibrio reynosensis]
MKSWLLFFLSLMPVFSWAASATEWSLNLDSKIESTYFPEIYGYDTNRELYKLELNPIYKWKYKDSLRLYLKPTLIANPNNNSEEERYFADPTEAYLRYKGETASVQVGYTIFSWGVTDGYNPLDVINSKQYFDPLHSRKLGAPVVDYSQTFGSWDIELVYIPQNRGAILPGTESRWLPREIYVPEAPENDLVLALPDRPRYKYGTETELDDALKNNAAFRVQYHGAIVDVGLSFYEGVAAFPIIQPVVTGDVIEVSPKTVLAVAPDITLNTRNYRTRHAGLAFTSNQFGFLFKLASAYNQSLGTDPYLPGWSNDSVVGFEKQFSFDKGLLVAVLQHSFTRSQKESESNLSVSEIFRSAWMMGFRLSWAEVWTYSLSGLYDSNHGSNFYEVGLSRRFFDRWVLGVSGSYIAGESDTPLGVYEKNDSFSMNLSASF